jgi:hypothetical protein
MAEQYVEAHGGRLEASKQGSSSAPREIDDIFQSKIISPCAIKNDFDRGRKTRFNCNKQVIWHAIVIFIGLSRESSQQKEEKTISAA